VSGATGVTAVDCLRLGTRGSALAIAQSRQIADRVERLSGLRVELVPVTTQGDTDRRSFAELGGTGLFVAALREALLAGDCDFIVHSLKDLPTVVHEELVLASIPKRVDPRDVICGRDGRGLDLLPPGATVGTGSPRRIAQVRAVRPDLCVIEVRGNIDTRLGYLTSGRCDAVVLAAAGLERLGRLDAVTDYCDLARWPTAAGQGALAVEVVQSTGASPRPSRLRKLNEALARLDHAATRATVSAERWVLAGLEAGCQAPLGVTAFLEDGLLFLSATVYSSDGAQRITSSHAATSTSSSIADLLDAARDSAHRVIAELLGSGAAELACAVSAHREE